MKIRSRRLIALMLSAAMVFPAAPAASAAEGQESLQSHAPEETQVKPAPETAAETQPQTAAETQAQTAAETQPQTAAETQAQSASETQAAPETQPQSKEGTESGTQISESSRETEAQEETEPDKAEKESFEAKEKGVSLKLTLPKGKKLPADTKLTLKISGAKSSPKQMVLVQKALEKAQHTVEKVCLLTITAVGKDGKAVTLPKGTTLSFSFGNGLDLGIAERREGKIHFLTVGDQASDAGGSLKLSQDQTKLVSASVSLGSEGKGSLTYAVVSLQNRKNSGGKLSAGDVSGFAGAGVYAAAAEHFDGKKDEKTQVLAGDRGEDDEEKAENLKKAQSLLGKLASYSASLADAQDSDSVRIVNLYADDAGNVNTAAEDVTDPMYGVKAADGTIDVTSGYVVVNIIAKSADQTIHIPDFAVTYSENGKAQAVTADAHPELAQHLIVNITAGNGRDGKDFGLVSYTGTADRGGAVGVYLAPAGTIRLAGTLTGAVYAKSAAVEGKLSHATEADQAGKSTEDREDTEDSVQTPVTVDGTIVVYMDLYRASTGKRLPVTIQKQYRVRVFMDAGGTLPYGDAQILTVPKNNSTSGTNGSARFTVPVDALHGTTYYVYEVDAEGRPIQNSSDMKIQIKGGDRTGENGAAVTMKAMEVDSYGAKGTYVVTDRTIRIQNLYTDSYYNAHRSEFMSNGTFDIQLKVVDASGNELPVDNLVAEFRVRTGDGKLALKNNQKITLKNTSVGERRNISFPVPIDTGKQTMGVTLMSIRTTAGVSLAKDYTLLTASYDGSFSKVGSRTGERTFTIHADAENQGPVVFVLRKNETNEKASLTLTKSVIYKKTPIRVNATYYIGIFADAAHTKLLFKKAMSLKDASSMSDTLKVNINSQKGRTITLYFAETDRNGKVVESGKKTGYNISISQSQVTLSQSNMTAGVTVTNEILDGSRAAERLTDPDSGFAGDSAALADAQALASSSNLNSRTGDDSPLMRYALLLVIAGAGVAAGLYLVLRRRKT